MLGKESLECILLKCEYVEDSDVNEVIETLNSNCILFEDAIFSDKHSTKVYLEENGHNIDVDILMRDREIRSKIYKISLLKIQLISYDV